MSVIAAIISGNDIWIGSDSKWDNPVRYSRMPKFIKKNNFFIGVSGSGKLYQDIQRIPMSLTSFDYSSVLPILDQISFPSNCSLIIATREYLYTVENDRVLLQWKGDFCAIGEGRQAALGYLSAPIPNVHEGDRIRGAIAAASRFSDCGGEVFVEKI